MTRTRIRRIPARGGRVRPPALVLERPESVGSAGLVGVIGAVPHYSETTSASSRSSAALPLAPTIRFTGSPSLNRIMVGMETT